MTSYLRFLLAAIVVLSAIGCSSTYKHSELQPLEAKLDSRKGVLISTPKDGFYGDTQYHGSGRQTANAVRAAFSKHAAKVDMIANCHGDDCLDTIDVEKYGYYVKPEILHWEDRATEWSGKLDRLEIQLTIYNAVTKKGVASSTYTGASKWGTFGGDHPQDLLSEPTDQYVNGLYQ